MTLYLNEVIKELINYRQQHVTFVQHANTTIQSLEQQKIAMEEEIAKAEAAILQRSQQQGRNSMDILLFFLGIEAVHHTG